jgi:hypothetical protein
MAGENAEEIERPPLLRARGIAARFASGYLIQLTDEGMIPNEPRGVTRDVVDLHAWAEAYIPGAGWIGLDPTSGLLAGEGHIPLACTASPGSAAPITGMADVANVEFAFDMHVTRIREDPRVTRPYTDAQWAAIDALGERVDAELAAADVRLTQGGEPTFVAVDAPDEPEWNHTAMSPAKRRLAETLLHRLHARFARGGLLHFGQGKWYPGEPLPRWALGVFWRADGEPLWRDDALFADTSTPGAASIEAAHALIRALAERPTKTYRVSCSTKAPCRGTSIRSNSISRCPASVHGSRACFAPASQSPPGSSCP